MKGHVQRYKRKGTAFILSIIALGVLVSISVSISYVGVQGYRKAINHRDILQARMNAESGLKFFLYTLKSISPARSSDPEQQMENIALAITGRVKCTVEYDQYILRVSDISSPGSGTFQCALAIIDDSTYRLFSLGNYDQYYHMVSVECDLEPGAGLFSSAAFGDKGVHLNSNAMTDSYDSSKGTWASQAVNQGPGQKYANTNGDCGSNMTVSMDNNAKVYGDAVAGPGYSVNNNGGIISGDSTTSSTAREMPEIEIPGYDVWKGNITIDNTNDYVTLGPGNIGCGDVLINPKKNGGLALVGPAKIVVSSLVIESNCQLVVDNSAGDVEIYVDEGKLILKSNTSMGNPDDPTGFLIYATSDFEGGNGNAEKAWNAVVINSNADLYAGIYAPNAVVGLDSNGEIYGSIIGKYVELSSNMRIHYDEHMLYKNSSGIEFAFETTTYTEYRDINNYIEVFPSLTGND